MPENKPGLTIERYFTKPHKSPDDGNNPFDSVEWEERTAEITNADGSVVFRQEGCWFPKSWSQQATNVVAQKYFRVVDGIRENSVQQMITRVANVIGLWGVKSGYFRYQKESLTSGLAFRDELIHILLHQMMAFNSPVWFNVGVKEYPQCSACFINSVEDTMESILDLAKTEGMLFKGGSGTGTNLSNLRSSHEKLSGGGTASGPVSFMRGFDAFAGAIKSGGTTRRAAKMVILDVDHPDIVQFIECKAKEEEKAHALIDAGYDGGFNVPGGAYDTVGYQNANHSVRVSDEFMQAVEDDGLWFLNAQSGDLVGTHSARDLLRKMAEAAWACGDPGIQFDDTINSMHTCPNSGRINASNPCSEYMFLDDSACNLASLNLMKFRRDDGRFDVEAFKHAIRITITAMEIIVGNSSYPTEKIRQNSHEFRPLGLGYANLGALLMVNGLPYDSHLGRSYAAAITSLMCGEAYAQSARISRDSTGPFPGYKENKEEMLGVISRHYDSACEQDPGSAITCDLVRESMDAWNEALNLGIAHGFRNAQATVLAPTGTIAFLMDCDTTGIEPDIALVKYKRLVGGGVIKIVNQCVPEALIELGYTKEAIQKITQDIEINGTIEGVIEPADLPVFDCAFKPENGSRSISPMGHLRMMEAVQPFLSGAISKTVNLPSDCPVEAIEQVYLSAWKMGLKAVAVYRDGCKRTQPLSTTEAGASSNGRAEAVKSSDTLEAAIEDVSDRLAMLQSLMGNTGLSGPPSATRVKLESERSAVTHRFSIGGHKGYITVGLYENGQPGEIFVKMAKEGSTVSGLMDSFATSVSIGLQYGVPLSVLCDKFKGTRFEPSGFTGNPEIPIATSISDYLARWLMLRYGGTVQEVDDVQACPPLVGIDLGYNPPAIAFVPHPANTLSTGTQTFTGVVRPRTSSEVVAQPATTRLETDAPPCHECGTIMVRNGSCHRCPNCGATSGCS